MFKSKLVAHILTLSLLISGILLIQYPTTVYGVSSEYAVADENIVPVSAGAAAVIDVKNGNILYSKNGQVRHYPASCTKILSALVAIEKGELKQHLTVSENAVYNIDPDSSHIALDVGEVISLEDCLYGMLLASGNDCSVAVAEGISGSVDKFSDLMNKKAEDLGCVDSHFTNPHGLYHEEHYTTPLDLAKIMRCCISNKTFLKIDKALKYTIDSTNKTEPRELWNNHRMLKNKYCYYAPVVCGKSGYITKSKFNLVSYGMKDGIELIVVAMEGDDPTSLCKDTQALMEYYFSNYKAGKNTNTTKQVETIKIADKKIPVKYKKDFSLLLPNECVTKDISLETLCTAKSLPIKKGDQLGHVQAVYKGQIIGTTPLYADKTILSTKDFFVRIAIVSTLALIIVFLLVVLIIKHKKRRKYKSIYRYKTSHSQYKRSRH